MPHSPWPFLDHPGPLAFAHRGGAGEWPENTMPAFEHAVGLGYRYVETDVHATADGVLVAFHDDALDRVTDRTGKIADLPWSYVAEARVDGREPIPRLDDLLGHLARPAGQHRRQGRPGRRATGRDRPPHGQRATGSASGPSRAAA